MRYCSLCGETLAAGEEGFHRFGNYDTPTWEACMRAASGDYDQIIRVHHALNRSVNPEVYD